MLVTFYSDAYANVTFFGEIAEQLLQRMGHSGVIPSALTAKEVGTALENLERALGVTDNVSSNDNTISLKHRALPLIKMLQAAKLQDKPVMWREGF